MAFLVPGRQWNCHTNEVLRLFFSQRGGRSRLSKRISLKMGKAISTYSSVPNQFAKKPMPPTFRPTVLLLAVLAIAGCRNPIYGGKSPLMPAQMSPDSVGLEMFFVRFPFGDTDANETLWKEIDEQHFSPRCASVWLATGSGSD